MKELLLFSLLCALVAALLATWIAPREQGQSPLPGFFLFAILGLVLPFLGAVLSLAYATAMRSVRHHIHAAKVEPLVLPPPARDFRLRVTGVAPGGIMARLERSRDPQQRVAALSQVVGSRFAEQYRLLRAALRDEAEEVRLLAYAALDQREQENTELLMRLQEELDECRSLPLRRRLQGYLAWLRWNIEHSISREAAEPLVHTAPVEMAAVADPAVAEESPALLRSLRSLELARGDLALRYLQEAEDDGVAESILCPYRAAAAFERHDLQGVRDWYRQHPELALSFRYGPSYAFWTQAIT
ncbi:MULTISPECIES: hypothetical protein [Acidithiobacillaceae]|uniref:hypothetical protein n=1 Tax=Acidithiobacillaceae TaxID=225058 RepID=UPI001D00D528|nr:MULTISPECIES: hypothetical protein [Acidithiobacillaceae]